MIVRLFVDPSFRYRLGYSVVLHHADNGVLLLWFQVTREVSLLSRWMAVDLYMREVDNLRFELSMNQCSAKLSRLAHEVLEKGLA